MSGAGGYRQTIVVTGAAGFIGSHLAQGLARAGQRVIGVDRFSPFYSVELKQDNAARLAQIGVPVLAIDLVDSDLTPVLAEADAVVHLAAQPGLADGFGFEPYLRDNIVATQRLVDAAQRAPRLQAFVYASTSSVYGAYAAGDEHTVPAPVSHYGVTKLAAEQLVLAAQRAHGLPASVFRLFSVFGPRERPEKLFPRLIRALLDGTPFTLHRGSGQHRRSFTYVDDVVMGLTLALDRHAACLGEIFNLGNPTSVSTAEVIAIAERLLGRELIIREVPARPGDQHQTQADIAKIRRVLGFTPHTSMEEGLSRMVALAREGRTA